MNIIDTGSWDDVYLIETSDYVLGGVEGTSNKQARALANRTRYLRDLLEAIETEIASMPTSDAMAQALELKADKTYTDNKLGLKADKTYTDNKLELKADKTYVDANFLAATKGITVTSGEVETTNRASVFGHWLSIDWNHNFADIYPPAGFSMSHLVGFMCSPAIIHFNGAVNSNDTLYCRYQKQIDRVRIICQNSENRSVSYVNYLAMWQK